MSILRGKQTQLIRIALFSFGIFMLGEAQAAKRPSLPQKAPAKIAVRAVVTPAARLAAPAPARNPASAREISEAIDITGQSRNLSMGLMFQRDKDKLSFGSPRTNYKDKITSQQTNY